MPRRANPWFVAICPRPLPGQLVLSFQSELCRWSGSSKDPPPRSASCMRQLLFSGRSSASQIVQVWIHHRCHACGGGRHTSLRAMTLLHSAGLPPSHPLVPRYPVTLAIIGRGNAPGLCYQRPQLQVNGHHLLLCIALFIFLCTLSSFSSSYLRSPPLTLAHSILS